MKQRLQVPLIRKEFFELAQECRSYAFELARHDQTRVNLKRCYEFNEWLSKLRSYEWLAPALSKMNRARPIARWQLMTLGLVLGFVLFVALPSDLEQNVRTGLLSAFGFILIIFYFVPERIYGTTIELIEGKVLRVVDELDEQLKNGERGFTEAAFFQVKDDLETARRELRQQIDLAHRGGGRGLFG